MGFLFLFVSAWLKKEKSPYLRLLEFSISHLPKGLLLIEGNSMAIQYLDYFKDRYSYPFSVVPFVDLMEISQAIFFRFKPPPIIITQIDMSRCSVFKDLPGMSQ
jgi:hypothetical protein